MLVGPSTSPFDRLRDRSGMVGSGTAGRASRLRQAMRLSEGERLDDEAVVGIDGKTDGIGGDTIGGDADIYLSGIIFGHTVLVVVKTEVTGARAVGICQHGVGDESQSLDGCGVVGHAGLE